jgi:hypothetical protein
MSTNFEEIPGSNNVDTVDRDFPPINDFYNEDTIATDTIQSQKYDSFPEPENEPTQNYSSFPDPEPEDALA